jgi:hypothetical protein
MKLEIRPSIFILWVAMTLALCGEVIYQSVTIETQAHTILEQLGLAVGPDATPLPPKALVPPVGPEPPTTFTDKRRWQTQL